MDNSTENKIDSKINQARDGVTQIGKDLRGEAHSAIDKVADKVPAAADKVASTVHDTVKAVADKVDGATDTVNSAVSGAADSLVARGKKISATYKSLAESGRGHVRTSPAISVLLAAAAGYGLSKLLTSRSAK